MSDTVIAPPAEPEPQKSGGGLKVALGIAGVAVLALAGVGAYAWTQLSGGGTQPHDVLPADTIAYARIDLDPSASQKVALLRLVDRVPEIAEEIGIDDEDDDLRRVLVEGVLESSCDVDYDDDVEPWLGERLGVGLGPDLEDEQIRIAVQVTDEDAARDGIATLFECAGEEFGIAFLDGYAIVTPTQDEADAAVEAAGEGSLADTEAFAADLDDLGDDGLVSVWADLEEAGSLVSEFGFGLGFDEELADTGGATSVFLALRAGSDSLEIGGFTRVADEPETPDVRGLGDLPDDTVAAISVVGAGEYAVELYEGFLEGLSGFPFGGGFDDGAFEEFEEFDPLEGLTQDEIDELREILGDDFDAIYGDGATDPLGGGLFDDGLGFDPEGAIEEFGTTYDLRFPEDLESLFGDALTLYVGSTGLRELPTLEGPEATERLSAGLVLSGGAGAADLAERLVAAVTAASGIELVAEPTDDGAVIATNAEVAEALTSDGDLGSSDAFESVMAGGGPFGGFFVDVAAIIAELREADPPEDVDSFFDDLSIVRAVGVSGSREDDRIGFSVKVSFTDE
ncbi:hypothetical protein [Aeromicrobium marinum]|uniref:hypothetical protein n=1 Tax=Aeromicrobium marinum TaxID=219314 RepID=UPI0005912A9F|nr:hypothetical protein [Aeromicrobium marinum]